jgi:hypothetical protein
MILRAGLCGISSTVRQPDHTAARGQPRIQPARASAGSTPGLPCGSPSGRSTGCHTLPNPAKPQQHSRAAISESCLSEGTVHID